MREFTAERNGMRIYGKIALPDEPGPHPLVIFSHGFGASRVYDSGMHEWFVERGIAFAAFDFCGGGIGSQSSGSPLDMSVLTEVADLNAVMNALRDLPEIDAGRLFLMGSSQGGYVSAYVAATRPDDVRALILFFPAFVIGDDARKRWDECAGKLPETSTIGRMTVGPRYTEDALSLDIYAAIGGYPGDVLIAHGSEDPIVPLAYSERAAKVYGDRARLIVIEGMGHGFRTASLQQYESILSRAADFIGERG